MSKSSKPTKAWEAHLAEKSPSHLDARILAEGHQYLMGKHSKKAPNKNIVRRRILTGLLSGGVATVAVIALLPIFRKSSKNLTGLSESGKLAQGNPSETGEIDASPKSILDSFKREFSISQQKLALYDRDLLKEDPRLLELLDVLERWKGDVG